jgi:MFS family permease
VAGQIPGGAVADATTWKRGLAALGIIVTAGAALVLALAPSQAFIYAAQALHGLTAGVMTGAIAAISLGLVGRGAMSYRFGRNYRFSAAGNALTAGGLGLIGSYFGTSSIFLAAAALCIPALVALGAIRPEEIDYARARNAGAGEQAAKFQRAWDLRKNRPLLIFACALVLFQLADAAMLPSIGAHLGQEQLRHEATFGVVVMSVLVIIPQIIVAVLAPWVGYHSERFGRKPLLLVGFGIQAVRALLLVLFDNYVVLALVQVLDGVSGAIIGVLTMLVITDVTTGSGRFNLARGVVATMSAIAASVSTAAAGFLIEHLGQTAAFLAMAAAGSASTVLVLMLLPETKPEKYLD